MALKAELSARNTVNHTEYLREVYAIADSNYTGRGNSTDFIPMLDPEFEETAKNEIDLDSDKLQAKIDRAIDDIYEPINSGVHNFVAGVPRLNEVLVKQKYLCGDRGTGADVCMFTTLYRFDAVYRTPSKMSAQF